MLLPWVLCPSDAVWALCGSRRLHRGVCAHTPSGCGPSPGHALWLGPRVLQEPPLESGGALFLSCSTEKCLVWNWRWGTTVLKPGRPPCQCLGSLLLLRRPSGAKLGPEAPLRLLAAGGPGVGAVGAGTMFSWALRCRSSLLQETPELGGAPAGVSACSSGLLRPLQHSRVSQDA